MKEELYVNIELQEMEINALFWNRFLTGVHIFPFLIPNAGIEVESTFRGMKVHFIYHCELRQVFVYLYYTSEMCTAFGVLKDVNISIYILVYRY